MGSGASSSLGQRSRKNSKLHQMVSAGSNNISFMSSTSRRPRMVERYMPHFLLLDQDVRVEEGREIRLETFQKVVEGTYSNYEGYKEKDSTLSPLRLFFDKFFEMFFLCDPNIRPMYKNVSLTAQGRMVMRSLKFFATAAADREDQVIYVLERLALIHSVNHKVPLHFYGFFADALLKTFRILLGGEFGEQEEAAWLMTLTYMYNTIIPTAVDAEINPSQAAAKLQVLTLQGYSRKGTNRGRGLRGLKTRAGGRRSVSPLLQPVSPKSFFERKPASSPLSDLRSISSPAGAVSRSMLSLPGSSRLSSYSVGGDEEETAESTRSSSCNHDRRRRSTAEGNYKEAKACLAQASTKSAF